MLYISDQWAVVEYADSKLFRLLSPLSVELAKGSRFPSFWLVHPTFMAVYCVKMYYIRLCM